MQDAKLFEQMLGLQAPWRVKAVELDMKGQKVVVVVEVTAGTQWGEGGQQVPVHGWEEREWRHLDTMPGIPGQVQCRARGRVRARTANSTKLTYLDRYNVARPDRPSPSPLVGSHGPGQVRYHLGGHLSGQVRQSLPWSVAVTYAPADHRGFAIRCA